jgi:tetratricopeptide (TPR) repeat protein
VTGNLNNASADNAATAQLLADAVQAHKRGDRDAAKALYEGLLRIHPGHHDALHLLGVIAYETCNHDLAVRLIRQALETYEANPAAHANLGLALQALERDEEARACFERSITLDPSNAGAWLGKGDVLNRLGQDEAALRSYEQALLSNPRNPHGWRGMAAIFVRLGRYADAVQSYDRAMILDPRDSASFYQRGNALGHLARSDEAIASFERAIELDPDHAQALHQRGALQFALGRTEQALVSFDAALAIEPGMAEAWSNRGNALALLGHRKEAFASFDQALVLKPDLHDALQNRGTLLAYLDETSAALRDFDQALAIRDITPHAHYAKGTVLLRLDRFNEALASFQRTLSADPMHVDALLGQASALCSLKNHSDALASVELALQLAPSNRQALADRAHVLLHAQRYEASLASALQAVSMYPDHARALNIKGLALQALGRPREALSSYEHALVIDPVNADAGFNASLLHLQRGEYLRGWAGFESRWRCARPNVRRHGNVPEWSGAEDLTGRRLLIWADEGLGDTLQFCRYAAALRERGVVVVLEVQAALKDLLAENLRGITVIARGDDVPACDFAVALLSLPAALKIDAASIPLASRYIVAHEAAVKTWRRRLHADTADRLRIGIAVSGNPAHGNDRNRSASLAYFTPLLGLVETFVVQKGLQAADAACLQHNPAFRYIGDEIRDFSDLAAIVDTLDLVITVDTATAHLAAAMGKPTWLLLPVNSDWRWLLDRDDSPWYPSVRMFRQRGIGDWPEVIHRVRYALADFIAQSR